MKFTRLAIVCISLMLAAGDALAQNVEGRIDTYGFFDNVEGEDSYRKDMTHFGLWVAPQLSVSTTNEHHSLNVGYDALMEPGTKGVFTDGKPYIYYKYDNQKVRFVFGSYPRRMMKEQMPDYLICDSIRYYRPNMTGFDILYTSDNGHVEAFLDWIGKQDTDVREQFMVGVNTRFRFGIFQLGLENIVYHYALASNASIDDCIHDYIQTHGFVGLNMDNVLCFDNLDIRTGFLFAADRERSLKTWHLPVGFVADIKAQWKRFSLLQTIYAGKRQQYFGIEPFGKYYWGDVISHSPWYTHTDISYYFLRDKNVSLSTGLQINFTDCGMNWHQCLTVAYTIGGRLLRRR